MGSGVGFRGSGGPGTFLYTLLLVFATSCGRDKIGFQNYSILHTPSGPRVLGIGRWREESLPSHAPGRH